MKTLNDRKRLEERAREVKRGGSLAAFKAAEIIDLQEYALDIKDIPLFDQLEKFWTAV